METARVTCRLCCLSACASMAMELGTPTVEMVMWRAPTPMSALMNCADASTERHVRHGSPCPMYTAGQTACLLDSHMQAHGYEGIGMSLDIPQECDLMPAKS